MFHCRYTGQSAAECAQSPDKARGPPRLHVTRRPRHLPRGQLPTGDQGPGAGQGDKVQTAALLPGQRWPLSLSPRQQWHVQDRVRILRDHEGAHL